MLPLTVSTQDATRKVMVFRWLILVILLKVANSDYHIGAGIADVTGPPAQVVFMGYGKLNQRGQGIHLRQFSRAFIFHDDEKRIVFVSVDSCMIGHGVRKEVLQNLSQIYDDLYTENNVIISATHTHSAPGGYMKNVLFDLSIFGFVSQSFEALVSGIVLSIVRAHESLVRGRLYVVYGELLNASANRSPMAYLNNPAEERSRYRYDVDKTMVQLRLIRKDGHPIGVIHWFAVHPTSMNNTNVLVSTDNVGLAAVMFEQRMNPGALIGKGPFIAAFASSNLGDVSPNIQGSHCEFSGLPCDVLTSSCSQMKEMCIASGPGHNMFESTHIIAERMFHKSWELWNITDAQEVTGNFQVVHQYVDMPKQEVDILDPENNSIIKAHGCLPAMGYSFAAGTTDGPGAIAFWQGMIEENILWNTLRNLLHKPTPAQIECHSPKPILLSTGEMEFPYQWQPTIVSTQLAVLGNIVLACVPGEFTTMAGRRIRDVISNELGITTKQVIIAGLCNTYSDYVTTLEEYQVQRYEGASTIYGPYTLNIYLKQFQHLAAALKQKTIVEQGPKPSVLPESIATMVMPVLFDTPKWNHKFGDCILQPKENAWPGDTVSANFVSANPRNNLTHEWTYLTIEMLENNDGNWKIVATDANWETRFEWINAFSIFGSSEALISWTIGNDIKPGRYRIRHFGSFKYIFGKIKPFEGTSNTFQVHNDNLMHKQ